MFKVGDKVKFSSEVSMYTIFSKKTISGVVTDKPHSSGTSQSHYPNTIKVEAVSYDGPLKVNYVKLKDLTLIESTESHLPDWF